MDEFEKLLREHRLSLERYVYFRLKIKNDADDVLQEAFISAYKSFHQLKNKNAFKAWLISIARNKCNDYFRKKASQLEIPIDNIRESELSLGRQGIRETDAVHKTLILLGDKDKQILYLYFFKDMPQSEIAKLLNIPLGTVKSRLHTAKQNFKNKYPYPPKATKGNDKMKKLPEFLPKYTIEKTEKTPFSVKWEEVMGWFIVPRLGEKLSWAMYDMPDRRRTETDIMEVVGKAEVHGIEGVEITVKTLDPMDCNSEGGMSEVDRTFIAQLTDTHSRYLAESHMRDGVKKIYTFLDGDDFLCNWGFGEDNCGNEIDLSPKGNIVRVGDNVSGKDKDFLIDIVGRYNVTICGKTYDTVCVMDIETYNTDVVSEQFLDKNGRTVLWRRFNRDDWAYDRYKKLWSEMLPESERLSVNGKTFVHWYDCITDYIL